MVDVDSTTRRRITRLVHGLVVLWLGGLACTIVALFVGEMFHLSWWITMLSNFLLMSLLGWYIPDLVKDPPDRNETEAVDGQ